MTRTDKIDFIKRVVADLGETQLGSKCGKYYALVDNGETIVAISFAGKYGYHATNIEEVSSRAINAIYKDLIQDFE